MSDLHKDQQRVRDALLPAIMQRVVSEEGVRDCTLINRLLIQGPDPLFLMEACPDEFSALCDGLGLTVAEGREAIESAHWNGPGCLLEGEGLPSEFITVTDPDTIPVAWRREALWLILAGQSDCTEEGYGDETSMLERIQRQAKAIANFARFVESGPLGIAAMDLNITCAIEALDGFVATTEFTPDPKFGKPMASADHGFYVGYKQGHPCVAVQSDTLTFYGTMPGTTLEAEGVTVDKVLSPQFGICFG